jgi:hypothetical protein
MEKFMRSANLGNQEKRRKQFFAWFVVFLMALGGFLIFIFLDEAVNNYRNIYQLRADSSIVGRTPPFDRPLLEGNELTLVEKPVFGWDFGDLPISNGESLLIAESAQPIKLRVDYSNYMNSISGYWRGERASIVLEGGLNLLLAGEPGNPNTTWGDSLSNDSKSITPYFDFSLPIDQIDLSTPWKERVIQISTELVIIAPGGARSDSTLPNVPSVNGFSNYTSHLEHNFELVVLTQEEINQYLEIRSSVRSHGLPILLLGIGKGLLVFIATIVLTIILTKKLKINFLVNLG